MFASGMKTKIFLKINCDFREGKEDTPLSPEKESPADCCGINDPKSVFLVGLQK